MRDVSRAARVALAAGLFGAIAALPLAAAPAGAAPVAATPPAAAPVTPDTSACPYQTAPAPPVDTSEVPPPGQQAPAALPVPRPPVGGDRLGACGVVTAGSADVPRGLTSAGWLVADATSGTVLAAKDPHGRYRPASTIKTLLALTALRDLDLDTVVTGTREDYSMEGDSAGIGPGGTYTVRQLLQGLLMVSGNDCANALARELGGYETAVGKMNDLAHSLGAKDTRAASPSGLDAPGMSTSPYDLALIFRAALRDPTFRDLISHVDAPFPGYPPLADVPGDKPHAGYQMQSQNRLLTEGFPGVIGGKTGFTDDARKTYVGAVERDGRTLVVVQMYGFNEMDDSYWDQAKALLEYGFAIPRTASVGTLVDGRASSGSGSTTTRRSTAGPAIAQNVSDEGPSGGGVGERLLIGGVGVVVVAGLVVAAVRINRRTR
ncbi:D-alanyl-D-alanine carboxypeptidase family protein [Williamsia deligens]|uniref:D-alanyl-D-alanine carboxypeptidase family protein n=1 Tax=Williamsia deligens TaxID=321325 RepID=A0ABW3G855_9NOCA|nr:D-alanyl-D-alanine carboxypeptidase family protein [Williamsia deligens]MCP2192339.1 D-alanyl-D-alanine carboxypeptidase (penicillin-binding protein 5/6) [Williamsia deligens]